MSNHPIDVAAAIAIGGVIALVAWLTTNSKVELPEPTPAPTPSMKLSRIELLHSRAGKSAEVETRNHHDLG